MKKVLIGLLAIVLLGGCTTTTTIEEDKIKDNEIIAEYVEIEYILITAEEAKEIIDTEEVTILDVRTPQEYEEGHIEGALLIPDYELKDLADSKLPDKDEKILVYCRSGNRSKSAAKILIDMGYTNVHDFGGIMAWPYETIKGE